MSAALKLSPLTCGRRALVVLLGAVLALAILGAQAAQARVVITSNVSYATGMAVDSAGDLFVADAGSSPGTSRVVEEKPDGNGGYTQSVVDGNLSEAAGVALDSAGDVFVADAGNNRVVEDKPNGNGGYTQNVVVSNLSNLSAIAVDSAGDLFISQWQSSNSESGDVLEEQPVGNGSYTQSVVTSNVSDPDAVAVDGSGDVFIADALNQRVVEETPTAGGFTQTVVDSNLFFPVGVAVNGAGDVFIADAYGPGQLIEATPGSGGFNSQKIASGLEGPLALDGAGDMFVGHGSSLVEETPNNGGFTGHVLPGSLSSAGALSVDASGGVFINDQANNQVVKETPNGAGTYTPSVVDNHLNRPTGVAVDQAGDVFISDYNNHRIVEDQPDGNGSYAQTVFASGVQWPTAVAVDHAGDVFVGEGGSYGSKVVEYAPSGTQRAVVDSTVYPNSIAVDSAGDVFIGDGTTNDDRVVEDEPNGGGFTQKVIDTNVYGPDGIAVDSAGDVFIADLDQYRLVEDKPNGDGSYTQIVLDNLSATGVALDGAGDVFYTDGHNRVLEVPPPPAPPASVAVRVAPDSNGDGNYTVTAKALDANGKVLSGYGAAAAFSDTQGNLGASLNDFVKGVSTTTGLSFSPVHEDKAIVTTEDASGQSTAFNVVGTLAAFSVRYADPGTVNTPGTLSVTAVDSAGNTVSSFAGSATFADAKGLLSNTPSLSFSGGQASTPVSFPSAVHADQITVTGSSGGQSITGTSPAFNISDGQLAGFAVRVAGPVTAGQATTLTVSALDSAGNVDSSYSGSPTVSDTDSALTSVPSLSFSDGKASAQVTFNPARNDYVTVSDSSTGQTVTGRSFAFASVGSPVRFGVQLAGPVEAQQAATMTVTAFDSAGNTDVNYNGQNASWQDAKGQLSNQSLSFTNGVATAQVTLPNPAHQDQITVTDDTTSTVTGQSAKFDTYGPVSGFAVKVAGPVSAGGQAQVTATAIDTAGNTITSYAGPATASDGASTQTLALSSFTGGVATGQLSFPNAAQADHVTVSDNGTSSIGGRSLAFAVVGPLAGFTVKVTGPNGGPVTASPSWGDTATITAVDSAGNPITTYNGTPAVTDTDSDVTVGKYNWENGTDQIEMDFSSPEAQDRIQVTDATASPAVTGQSAAFHVLGTINSYRVLVTRPVRAGHPTTLTVDALDSAGNTITTYSGQNAGWTDSGGEVTGAQPLTFTNGTASTQITLPNAAQNDTITVTDGSDQSASSTSLPFNVYGKVSAYQVSVPSNNNDPSNVPLTVTAVDSAGNTILGYTGTATATDSQTYLNNSPVQLTFTKGVATAQLSFNTPSGNDTITATDTNNSTINGTSQPFNEGNCC